MSTVFGYLVKKDYKIRDLIPIIITITRKNDGKTSFDFDESDWKEFENCCEVNDVCSYEDLDDEGFLEEYSVIERQKEDVEIKFQAFHNSIILGLFHIDDEEEKMVGVDFEGLKSRIEKAKLYYETTIRQGFCNKKQKKGIKNLGLFRIGFRD
jgi:hypothetical protein